MKNNERVLSRLIRELSLKHGFSIAEFSDQWLYCLTKGGRSRYIIGYDFDLNPAASQLIAKDKSATSDLLQHHGVPHVEHVLFHHPHMAKYVPFNGNWSNLTAYAQQHNFDVVCKPNTGTGGIDVYRVKTQTDLERIVQELFGRTRAVAVSPFYGIDHEFRLIVLNGRVQLAYVKVRPSVTGDGRMTMFELIAKYAVVHRLSAVSRLLGALADTADDLNQVPGAGQTCYLNWRHNLGQGSSLRILSETEIYSSGLKQLALRAAGSLNLRFASVDVVKVKDALLVLEINAGIMMESFATMTNDGYETAKRIYEEAILCMFADPI